LKPVLNNTVAIFCCS